MIFSKKAKLATLLSAVLLSAPITASADSTQPFIGELMQVGFDFCPRGYAFASGQLLAIQQNAALFSLLGTMYGGDGRTNFALPDLRGRVPINAGLGTGLSNYAQGQVGGRNSETVLISNMPSHTHAAAIKSSIKDATHMTPEGNHMARSTLNSYSRVAAPTGNMAADAVTVNNTGGSQAINTTQPALVVTWCIATQGIFPSRN